MRGSFGDLCHTPSSPSVGHKGSFVQHLEVRSSPQEADEERPDAAKPTAQDHDAQWGQLEPLLAQGHRVDVEEGQGGRHQDPQDGQDEPISPAESTQFRVPATACAWVPR